jgi:hypothetical protein
MNPIIIVVLDPVVCLLYYYDEFDSMMNILLIFHYIL